MLFLVQNLCWVSVTLNKTPPLTTVCRSNLTWFLPPFPATAHLTHYTPASFFLYSLSSTGCSPSLRSSSSGSLQRWLFLTAQVSAQMASPIRPPLWYLLLQEPLSIISLCVCVCVCVCACTHMHTHACLSLFECMKKKCIQVSVSFLFSVSSDRYGISLRTESMTNGPWVPEPCLVHWNTVEAQQIYTEWEYNELLSQILNSVLSKPHIKTTCTFCISQSSTKMS